jgi:hypothetical protein
LAKGTLFFVHGTGVRKDGFDHTLSLIADAVGKSPVLNGITVKGVCWGAARGVVLHRLPDVLPPEISRRGVVPTSSELAREEIETAMWAQLLDDPMFELRLAADHPHAATQPNVPLPSRILPAQELVLLLQSLSGQLTAVPTSGIDQQEIIQAASDIGKDLVAATAAEAYGGVRDPELMLAVARAIVATVLAKHRGDAPGTEPHASHDAATRDFIVDAILKTLQPATPRSVGGWLANKAQGFAERRATAYISGRRLDLTGLSLPGIGDILLYQRRGEEILDDIATELNRCMPPVVAVGHSLGGIMLVDLLSRSKRAKVDLLVTVGSQSPLFFMIDALGELRPTTPTPGPPFTPWLNIYDRSDLLSYCAERIFGRIPNIVDREVSSGVPFPESHSAYWHQPAVYELISEFWPTTE